MTRPDANWLRDEIAAYWGEPPEKLSGWNIMQSLDIAVCYNDSPYTGYIEEFVKIGKLNLQGDDVFA